MEYRWSLTYNRHLNNCSSYDRFLKSYAQPVFKVYKCSTRILPELHNCNWLAFTAGCSILQLHDHHVTFFWWFLAYFAGFWGKFPLEMLAMLNNHVICLTTIVIYSKIESDQVVPRFLTQQFTTWIPGFTVIINQRLPVCTIKPTFEKVWKSVYYA